jgi:hypothetical protein
VDTSAQSIKKAKMPRVVMTLERKLNIANFAAGKQAVNRGRELETAPKAVRTIVDNNSMMIHSPQHPHFKFLH